MSLNEWYFIRYLSKSPTFEENIPFSESKILLEIQKLHSNFVNLWSDIRNKLLQLSG